MKKQIKNLTLIFILSTLVTVSSILISTYGYHEGLIKNIFTDYRIFTLNFFLIFLLIYLLSYLFKSIRKSFLLVSLLINFGAYVNFIKIVYRQEPLKGIDLTTIFEAFKMSQKYDLLLSSENAKMLFLALILSLGLFFALKLYDFKVKFRLARISLSLILLIIFTKTYVFNQDLYQKLGSNLELNPWIEVNAYQTKGFIYPFVHSIKSTMPYKYKDYDKKRAQDIYSSYKYTKIADGKKVNVVMIMMESFKDFYKLQNEKMIFKSDPYWYFHALKEESISGSILVNSFGGGTFKTEINALTAYKHTPSFNKKTISYPQYFKDNEYTNYAFHPNTGAFYNRRNIYKNIGFDEFFEYDDTFSKISDDLLMDNEFYDFINEKFDTTIGPKFFFAVTYQNHGPYPSDYATYEEPYIEWQEGYDEADFRYFNNYLHGIESASNALKKIVDNLEQTEEPTIFVVFGDHSPSMGEGYKINKMLGINSDPGKAEGVHNIYETPYLIWANDSAKKVFNNEFVGQGREVEPIFLFSEIFKNLSYSGNNYNQFLTDFSEDFSIVKETLFKVDGEFTSDLSQEQENRLRDFYNVEYYTSKKKI